MFPKAATPPFSPRRFSNLLWRSGLQQIQFAERSGVAQSSISAFVAGKQKPRWATLKKLAAGLGVSETELLDPVEVAANAF